MINYESLPQSRTTIPPPPIVNAPPFILYSKINNYDAPDNTTRTPTLGVTSPVCPPYNTENVTNGSRSNIPANLEGVIQNRKLLLERFCLLPLSADAAAMYAFASEAELNINILKKLISEYRRFLDEISLFEIEVIIEKSTLKAGHILTWIQKQNLLNNY